MWEAQTVGTSAIRRDARASRPLGQAKADPNSLIDMPSGDSFDGILAAKDDDEIRDPLFATGRPHPIWWPQQINGVVRSGPR
jgi:hypothetical protein